MSCLGAAPSFLAMLLFEKYGRHQPLNRQAESFAPEGVSLSVSTLADKVGATAFALMPLYRRVETDVLFVQRLHSDNTTVPVMAMQDRYRQTLVVCPRRPAIRGYRFAGRIVSLFP
jgi:hypothetical protein